MENTTPTSNIIRKVTRNEIPAQVNEKTSLIVSFNRETRRIDKSEKKSILYVFKSERSIDHYLLSLDKASKIHCRGISINDLSSGLSLELEVVCELRWDPLSLSNQSFMSRIEAFIDQASYYDNMQLAIEGIITKTIINASRKEDPAERFIRKFYEQSRQHLVKSIQIVFDDLGFRAEVLLYPSLEKTILDSKTITNKGHIDARVKDYENNIDVEFSYEMVLSDSHKINAILLRQNANEIPVIFRDRLRYTLSNYSLNEFIQKLTDEIKQQVVGNANTELEKYGYVINFVSLKYKTSDLPVIKAKELSHDVHCTIHNFADKIKVTNKILLQVEDNARFLNSGIQDIDVWIKDQLDGICTSRLFDRSYLDVIFDHERPENDKIETFIKKELSARATHIGLTISQHFILPILKPLQLREEGLRINTVKEYATKRNEIKVKIQLILTGRIRDLRKVETYLENQIDLQDKIRETAERVIETELHKTEPERALLFNILSPTEPADGKTCEEALTDALRKAVSVFYIQPLDITLKSEESELKDRISQLSKGTNTFDIEVRPRIAANAPSKGERIDAEMTVFTVEYKILGVYPDRWFTFYNDKRDSVALEIESIEKTLKNDLVSKLQTLPMQVLRFGSYEVLQKIKSDIVDQSREKIGEIFGLMISFVNFVRQNTVWEDSILQLSGDYTSSFKDNRTEILKIGAESRKEELSELYRRRTDLINDNEREENSKAIADIEQRIRGISGNVPSFAISQTLDQSDSTGSEEDFSFDVFKKQLPADQQKVIQQSSENTAPHEDQ